MMIGVTYKDGVLVPDRPLRLKDRHLTVAIPDDAWAGEPQASDRTQPPAGTIRRQIDDILGRYARQVGPVPADTDKQAWHEHLDGRYGGR
jgi:hypothetical protein